MKNDSNGIAVVTGGGSGMGRAIARKLAEEGFIVVITGRRAAMLQQTATTHPHKIETVIADIATRPGIEALVAAINGRPIALLVPAAGIFTTQSLEQISPEDWQQMLAINVTSRLLLVQALRQQLHGGRILFIGSRSANTARKGALSYCVSQAASKMLQRCLQAELASVNIATGIVIPGPVDSQIMQLGIHADPAIYPDAIGQSQEPLIATEILGDFAAWLLLSTSAQHFSAEQWDIRDSHHHPHWLRHRSLYRITSA